MKHLLAINGSYRPDGITDQAVAAVREAALAAGAEVEVVNLRDYPLEFCRNCRECTQAPGPTPGACVQHDGMQALVGKIEAADAYVLACPTNFYSVTALFKRFMERLIVYTYWPWGAPAPKFRKSPPGKKALLISSCAAPGPLGRLFYATRSQLKSTAKALGARPVGTVFVGLIANQEHRALPDRAKARAERLVARLV